MPVAVRAADAGDLDALVDALAEVAAEGRWLGVEAPVDRDARRARYADMLATAGAAGAAGAAVFVAPAGSSGRELAGHATADLAPYGVATLGMLVRAPYRSQGVGRALIDAVAGWATAAGAHKIALEVWPHNTAAIALYERSGFLLEGRRVRHYRRRNGEIWDSVLMGRLLA